MLAGWFNQHGIQLDHDELSELFRFETFLCHHVVPAQKGDVQCMLLWNEWVRIFRHQESQFPALIREKEFRTAILDRYDAVVSTDGAAARSIAGSASSREGMPPRAQRRILLPDQTSAFNFPGTECWYLNLFGMVHSWQLHRT